jgi:RND family efflux transporter MFP subunit
MWQVLKTIQARLRFIVILAAVGAVILYWDTLKAHYEKWTRPILGEGSAVSSDTEFWCPMHPTVVRDKAGKCPICGMPLSKRKKSAEALEGEALPPGSNRVTETPYRIAAAGIRTVPIDYQPLSKEITTVGTVEFDERKLIRISLRPAGRSRIDKLYANVTGQTIQPGEPLLDLYSPELVTTVQNLLNARRAEDKDVIRDRLRLWGIAADQIAEMERAKTPPTRLTIRAPFNTTPGSMWHVIKKYALEGEYVEEGSKLFDLADFSSVWIEAQVYEDDIAFLKEGLAVSATTKAYPNREFKGKIAFIHPHLDAGTRTLRVRFDIENPDHELDPGMYATVRLQVPATQLKLLPPDASEKQNQFYRQGLILAVPERAVIDTGSRKLVYREAEMDVYERVEVQLGPRCSGFYPVIKGLNAGERVAASGSFLIDAETQLTAGAGSTYFGASGGPKGGDRHSAISVRPSATRTEDAKVKANLDKLSAEDRPLAEAQGFCPILPQNRLGSMGKPVMIMVKGQPVFLCCQGCKDQALAKEDQTLANVEKMKTKAKAALPKK